MLLIMILVHYFLKVKTTLQILKQNLQMNYFLVLLNQYLNMFILHLYFFNTIHYKMQMQKYIQIIKIKIPIIFTYSLIFQLYYISFYQLLNSSLFLYHDLYILLQLISNLYFIMNNLFLQNFHNLKLLLDFLYYH